MQLDIIIFLVIVNDIFVVDHADTQHQFNSRENDWGFTSFMSLGELYDPSRGYLVNDTCVVEAEVAITMDPWLYDSKKETGFVGLKNQGATCYMNSLLQTLYHIPFFRKVSIFVSDSLVLCVVIRILSQNGIIFFIGFSGCVPYANERK